MNETFNFRRFGLLFKKTIAESSVQIFGVFIAATLISWLFYPRIVPDTENMWSNNDIQLQLIMNISLWIIGYNLVALFASNFSNNAKSYQFLLLPVSRFEQWLAIFLIVVFVFPTLYLILFRFIDSYQVAKYHASLDPTSALYAHNYAKAAVQLFTDLSIQKMLSVYTSAMALLVIGALYFKKSALIKTSIGLVCLYFFFTLFNATLIQSDLGVQTMNNFLIFDGFRLISKEGAMIFISHTPSVKTIFQIIFLYSLPIVLWLIAYLRLGEKEV